MERLELLDGKSPEEIEQHIGLVQRIHQERMQELIDKNRRRMQELQVALNEARERERRESIERASTSP